MLLIKHDNVNFVLKSFVSNSMRMRLKIILLFVFGLTSSLTTSFDLSGVISGNSMAGVPLGRSLGDGELDVEGICSEPGVACQNCTHAVTCVPLPVGWLKVPLQQCPEGQTCNAHEGRCSENFVPECDVIGQKYEHTCEQVGIFPDAYDCRKFHLCSPPEGLPDGRPADRRTALCPRHYGYNPQNAQCSIKLHKGQCIQKQVPDCTTVGQTGVLPLSPNHYYVCLVKNRSLYPQIFICPHGLFFLDGFCRADSKLGPITPPDVIPADSKATGDDGKIVSHPESREGLEKDKHVNTNNVNDKKRGEDGSSNKAETASTEHTMTHIEWFFSTEKTSTYAADTFLADKFDLANYESVDDVAAQPVEDFANSFESGADFW